MKERLKDTRKTIIYFAVILLAAIILWSGHQLATGGQKIFGKLGGAEVYPAKVTTVLARELRPYTMGEKEYIEVDVYFYAKVTSGPRRGETILVKQIGDSLFTTPIKEVEEGDHVMISYSAYSETESFWVFQEYNRSITLLVLLIIFFVLMFLFGGKKGIAAILSLVFTCLCIFYFFLPAILSGWNIYGLTIFCCVYIVAITLILVNGLNFKSLSAAIGCVGGLLVAGLLFFASNYFLRLTGVLDEESSQLMVMNVDNPINLKAIIFASVLIGVLGGVLDVGVSIAASLNEIYGSRKDFTFKDVVSSGMNIGRDIICTMTNTLILAYIGGGLSLTILLVAHGNSFLEILNRETIVVEVLQALLGSLALLFTIPLTTFFYAFALTRKKKENLEVKKEEILEEKAFSGLEAIKKIEEREDN